MTNDPQDDGLAGFARGGGSLWVARHQAGEFAARRSRERQGAEDVHQSHVAYAVGSETAERGLSRFDSVERIDAATNTVTNVPLPPPVAEIAVGGGFAWASNEAKGTVYKIDRSGRIVATYETGDGARQMSYADGTLWVVNQDAGTVTGIDAATGAERIASLRPPAANPRCVAREAARRA